MQTRVVVGLLWLGSLILAWFLGNLGGQETGRAEREQSSAAPDRKQGLGPRKRASATPSTAKVERGPSSATGAAASTVPPKPEPLDFDSLKSAQQFSDEAMAIIDAHLRRGPEGHRDLMLLLSEFGNREEQIEMLFAKDISEAPKLIYPWLRLLVHREQQVVDFVDTVFETAAETPDWFKALDPQTLGMITDAIGPILPGMTSDEVIARIRKNLGKVLQKGEGALPEALADNFEELQELYEAWAGPLAEEDARNALLDSSVSAEEKFQVLKRAPPAAAAGIELAPIIGPALEEDEWDAIAQLQRFKLGDRDRLALDEVIYKTVSKSEYSGWMVGQYLEATKRGKWIQQRPFIEEGIRRGGKVRTAIIGALMSIEDVPDAYVNQLLALSDLTEEEREALEGFLLPAEDEEKR